MRGSTVLPLNTSIAIGRAQQAVNKLQLALLVVVAVAQPRQFVAAALHIARRYVVEHQRADTLCNLHQV